MFMEQTTMKQFIQGDEKVKYEVLMQALNFKIAGTEVGVCG